MFQRIFQPRSVNVADRGMENVGIKADEMNADGLPSFKFCRRPVQSELS